MYSGLCYSEQKLFILGIGTNLVEFDMDKMEITKNFETKYSVYLIEKVNDDTFLTGGSRGYLELINKKDLTSLSSLKLEGFLSIN